ncbi:MAG: sigma-70 family RNA polymerase sigma factor [Ruminococcaceae bacterium]|nr:sigma-70 family RNA polymerase sigma factor [Oscillospiraceae bacterium]
MEGKVLISAIIAAIENDIERDFITDIYNKYYPNMKMQAYNIVRSNEEAEELVHDAFVKLIDKVDTVMNVAPEKLPSYIMATVRNIAINKWKKNKKDSENSFSLDNDDVNFWIKDSNALPEDLYIKNETLRILSGALAKLPERDRLLLEAKYILRQKDEEISKQFDISPQCVRIYVMRARRKAYTILEKEGIYE